MIFNETSVVGAYRISLERHLDQRGYFARAWCQKEFEAKRLTGCVAQINFSYNARKGTLRGMHYQVSPAQEAKVVGCTRGAIYDVVLDLRPESSSYLRWDAVELTGDNHCMLYVPEGCAHGFQTLTDNTDVLYFMSEFYSSELSRGFRFDDSTFAIKWPLPVECLSAADEAWPRYERPANVNGFVLEGLK